MYMNICTDPGGKQGYVAFQVQPEGGTNDLQPLVKPFHLNKIWMYQEWISEFPLLSSVEMQDKTRQTYNPSATAEVQRRLQDPAGQRPGKATAELDGGAGALAEGA